MDLVERLRSTRLDAALAVVFVVAALVQNAIWPIAGHGLAELYVLGATLPLAWRRTLPVEAALVSASFQLIPLDGYPVLGFVVVILQFFALGADGEPRTAVALVSAWAAATAVVGTLLGPEAPVAAIGAVLVVLAPVLAGRVVRHLRGQNEALAALTRELADERDRAEEAAVGAERARIAQELHDVVGHELTLIAIQAEAAGTALRVDPGRAAEPVEAIRRTAHRTLGEMRSVLGVLAPTAPESATDGIAELSRRAREAGIANELVETGTPSPGHAPVSLAVNRIVRECLTNAGRHAPGNPVSVRVDWHPDHVRVLASNAAPRTAAHPGRGLTGMRHRAELLGGSFTGRRVEDRFEVEVRMPVGEQS
ncbi:MAG: hypothetical protein J7518_06355 [Nocardioidaceae bacterium]|nr:hypothetical protein [Nocardioidaceae bacterium]